MRKYSLIILFMVMFVSCQDQYQKWYQKAGSLKVSWTLIENDAGKWVSRGFFTLENTGNELFNDNGWKLYFSQMGAAPIPGSIGGNVGIEHLNGDWQCLSPKEGFMLGPGEKLEIPFERPGRIIKEAEAPSGLYIVFEKDGQREAFVLENYQVVAFPALDKVFPAESGIPLPDAAWEYGNNKDLRSLQGEEIPVILPAPRRMDTLRGSLILGDSIEVVYDGQLDAEAGYLAELLGELNAVAVLRPSGIGPGRGDITLVLDADSAADSESYSLTVAEGRGVEIRSPGRAGVFYGIQSLLSLVPVEAWGNPEVSLEIRCVNIVDKPVFGYRGQMLDVGRNFHSVSSVKRLIRAMAYYKLNRFHISLTNDEAWRIEIPGLPELTGVGAFRGHTTTSKDHLIPAYGSGPFPDPERGVGSGYYSREEFVDLLKFAALHHVKVIPEINFPGHARAAIYAMEARYDRLMAEGLEEEALEYRLIDPQDESVYNSAQNFDDNVVCVCREEPYRLFAKVVDELSLMYTDAGLELDFLHVGGDEVPAGSWTASPLCEAYLAEHPEIGGTDSLQAMFSARLLEMLSDRGIVMAGWEEVGLLRNEEGRLVPNRDFAGKGLIPCVWNSRGPNLDLGNRMANAGYEVILCNVDKLYFDLAYSHHPAEPGLYWGGFLDTKSAWQMAPFHVFNAKFSDQYRRPYSADPDFSAFEALEPEARKNIMGIQAQLWSETLKGPAMLESYYLPRLLALSERAWCGEADWASEEDYGERRLLMEADWSRFAHTLGYRELPRLDYLFGGYNYHLPVPGAMLRDGLLHANAAFPGLQIRYTTNGTVPDGSSALYEGPVEVEGTVKLSTFDRRGRASRISIVEAD